LDGLRGVAVLGVLCTHIGPQDAEGLWIQPLVWFARLGWTGVDLFFVLSGFLITGILVNNRKSPNYFRAFYWHRTLRIFPLYFLLLVPITISAIAAPGIYHSMLLADGELWPYWLFMSNLRPFFQIAAVTFLLPTWSLAIEEQFYVVWSVIAKFLDAKRVGWTAAALLLVTIGLRFWMMAAPSAIPGVIFYFTFTHLDGLCVGAMLRVALDSGRHHATLCFVARHWWVPALIVAAILVADRNFGSTTLSNWYQPIMVRIGFTIISWLFGAVLLHGILIDGWVRLIADTGPLRAFGKYSYCIYLFAGPVLFALSSVSVVIGAKFGTFILVFVQVLIMYLVGRFSYNFIEEPILRMKRFMHYTG